MSDAPKIIRHSPPPEVRSFAALAQYFLLCSLLALPLGVGAYAGYYFPPAEGRPADFAIYLTAATLVRDGRASELYDIESQQQVFHEVTGGQYQHFMVWNHHPAEALLYLPAAFYSYETGLALMQAWNTLLLWSLALWALLRAGRNEKAVLLIFTALMFGVPFFASAIAMAQDSLWILVLALLGLVRLNEGRDAAAGALLGAATLKLTVIFPLLAVLFLAGYRRAAGMASAVAAGLVVLPAIVLGPHVLARYGALLVDLIGTDGELGMYAELLWNFRGLAIHWAPSPALAFLLTFLCGVLFAAGMSRCPRRYAPGLALLGAAFFSPHLYRHDGVFYVGALLLLIIAKFADQGRATRSGSARPAA